MIEKGQINVQGKSGVDILQELTAITSSQHPFSGETKTYVLVHAAQAVRFAMLNGQKIEPDVTDLLNPVLLQELRIFNGEGEFHLWRKDRTCFCWRFLDDMEGDHIESVYYLWGNTLEKDGQTLTDPGRGMHLVLPIKGMPGPETYAHYTVREYFAYDEDGNIRVQDARLVSISIGKKEDYPCVR